MNRLFIKRALPLVAAALFVPSTLPSRAGDAIIFPKDVPKSDPAKADPSKQPLQNREKLGGWANLPAADPRSLDGLLRPNQRNPRRKTREEQQVQREQDQKRNWLLLRPDQLEEEQERKERLPFPDRDDQADDGNQARDFTFYGLNDPEGARDAAGQDQRANASTRNPIRSRGSAESSRSLDTRNPASSGRAGQDAGAHAAKELDLSDLFGPGRDSRAAEIGKSDPIWRDILGGGTPTRTRDEHLNRLDRLGSSFTTEPKGSLDWGRAPAPPPIPKSFDSAPGSGAGGSFGPTRDFSGPLPSRNAVAPTMPDWNAPRSPAASRGGSSAFGNNSLDQQPVYRPSVIRPTVLEIPQRKL